MSSAGGPCQRLLYDREQRGVRYLRVSERGLYWYESTIGAGPRILRAPKDGSAEPEPFANVGAAVTIASDATHVYWIEFAKGITQAMRLSHDGGTPEPIPLGLTFDYPVMGEIDGDHVNIGDSSCLHIARVSTATLEVTTLRDQQGMLGGGGTVVAADDGTVYCAGSPEAGTENGQLIAVPKRGGDAQTMAEGIFEGIQHVEGWLYVIADRREHDARLERIATSGGSVEVVDEPGRGVANPGSGLRYDAARRMLYWRIGNDVRRYSVANGEAVDVLACRGSSLESDSDTAFLYEEDPWEQNPSSRIWAVPLSTLATWEDTFARWPDDASYGSRAGMIRCP